MTGFTVYDSCLTFTVPSTQFRCSVHFSYSTDNFHSVHFQHRAPAQEGIDINTGATNYNYTLLRLGWDFYLQVR